MKRNILIAILFLIFLSINAFASGISGSGLPACSNDDYVVTYSTATSTYACEAAPGSAGGDAWSAPLDSDIVPDTDNTYDLGSSAKQVADAFIKGTATIATLTATSGTVGGSAIATAASTTTFTNKTIDADGTGNSITNIENADIKSGAAIDAAKIHDGSVSNTEFGHLDGVTGAIQTALDGKAPSDGDGIVDAICGQIETPEDKVYWLRLNTPYPFTVDSITTDVDSGSITLALENDGTPITGCTDSDISVTTTETTDTCTSGNAVSTGADLELVASNNSSADDLRFCVKITRD